MSRCRFSVWWHRLSGWLRRTPAPPPPAANPTERAERLQVLLRLLDHPAEPLGVEDVALVLAADDGDFALAVACQQVAVDRRADEWAALEELLGLVAGQAGTLDERCEALAGPALLRAARVSGALGWLADAPE